MTKDSVHITYLLNSGFIVESDEGGWAMIFDAYRDMRGDIERTLTSAKKIFFFVSHAHGDHYSPSIARYEKAAHFFLSEDIRSFSGAARFPTKKTIWLGKYDGWEDENLRVESFDSTDEGTLLPRGNGRLAYLPRGGFQLVALEERHAGRHRLCAKRILQTNEAS